MKDGIPYYSNVSNSWCFRLIHRSLRFTGKDHFTMDFTWPLNPFQAFCICISSLDNKLACE